ncbi:hypothetical protein MAP00_005391 [Monascus purpureus]|nr:hypothetical protein MAP00_005391 [Monascus purpureus]
MGERMEGDSIEAPELSELENEALAAGQAHHSVRTAMLVYGRPQVQFGNLPINQQAAYIDFSQRKTAASGPQATAKTPQGLSTSSFPLNQPCLRFWWQRSASSPSPKIPIGQFNAFMGSTTPTFTPIDPNVTEGIPDGDPRLAELEPGQRLRLLAHQPFPQTPRGLQAPDLLLGLFQEFMGTPQAEFRSAEQRECLYHLLKPTPFLLMALPTAGGKTTLFLLAASLAWAHTTVLVVPLVSLKLNLQSKLQNLGLPWVNWEDQHEETPPTRLVLVSIESAVSQVFINWAMQLYHQNALDRIIFDEAHLIPLARSYRGVMNDVNRLSQVPVPKVFASATVPGALRNPGSPIFPILEHRRTADSDILMYGGAHGRST